MIMSGYSELIKKLTAPDDFASAQARGFVCIRMASNRILHAEGHRGILHYDTDEVSFRARGGVVQVLGRQLCISAYSKTQLEITGIVQSVNMRRTED
jgi:sporulation protein YqfC